MSQRRDIAALALLAVVGCLVPSWRGWIVDARPASTVPVAEGAASPCSGAALLHRQPLGQIGSCAEHIAQQWDRTDSFFAAQPLNALTDSDLTYRRALRRGQSAALPASHQVAVLAPVGRGER